jgi:hypothetical protein
MKTQRHHPGETCGAGASLRFTHPDADDRQPDTTPVWTVKLPLTTQ